MSLDVTLNKSCYKWVVEIVKKNKKNIPIIKVIIITSMLTMFFSISCIGYMVFSSWFSSSKQTTERMAAELNANIYNQVYSFLRVPEQINETNQKIISNGILNLTEEKKRDKYFVGVLSSHEEKIYSFSYGTANSEYYGARRNDDGIIEIMRNNASTSGNSWYYSVKKDLTADQIVMKTGKFDPRTRAWFQAAVDANAPTFSPIYKHFVKDDLAISYASPVYNKDGALQGVLGTHMLLDDVGAYLKDTVSKYNGYAVIVEKGSNKLIANSFGDRNFTVLQDGTLERYDIENIKNTNIQKAYVQYEAERAPNFLYVGDGQNLYINVTEIHMAGLDWVVMSAIPEGYLIAPAVQSIQLAVILAALSLLVSFIIYTLITNRLLRPINHLLQTANAFSSGDLTRRIDIVRNDEIGKISDSFNNVANKMQGLVNNLEATVTERTEELRKANITLEENKNQLRLILDTAAEAIFGIDADGNCRFCNLSCIKMLGYHDQEELLGKNMHDLIRHTHKDGTIFPHGEYKMLNTFIKEDGAHVDDEIFWRADGTSINVEYYSSPQMKNGEIIGAVITFMDISERKQKEAEIQHLNCYDTLTGLYNRRCFEENRSRIDSVNNLPLSVIFADINGLKMTNDIFGHGVGDELIKKSSEILKQSCRENDVIARVGGDEFIILLPQTNRENAENTIARIKAGFANARIKAIKCSISLGLDMKQNIDQPLDEIITNAENAMYKDKTVNRKSINKDMIDTIIETLHLRNPLEKQHSINVSEMCSQMGEALHLNETDKSKLNRAGYLHDIGKIVIDEDLLNTGPMNEDEVEMIRQHAAVGYRILNLFDNTLDLAEYVYGHHERWDGTGYPRGLKGEQTPLLSRIISVVEIYDRVLSSGGLPLKERKIAALQVIKDGAGTQFDPQLAEIFVQMIKNKEV